MALGDGRNPFDYLIDEQEESQHASIEPDPSYKPADECLELLTSEPTERRRGGRIQRVMAAGLVAPAAAGIVIIDLSLTGLRIGAAEPMDPQTSVVVQLPIDPPLALTGKIRWCRGHASGNYELGVQFDPLSMAQHTAYLAFLESLA